MAEHASLTTRNLPFLCLVFAVHSVSIFFSHLKPKVMVTWRVVVVFLRGVGVWGGQNSDSDYLWVDNMFVTIITFLTTDWIIFTFKQPVMGWWWCFCGEWGRGVARTVIQTTCESIMCLLPWLRSWQLTGSFSHSNNQWSERCVLHMKVNNSMNIYRKRWTILMWCTFAFLVVPPKPWILSTSPFLVYGSHPFPHNI